MEPSPERDNPPPLEFREVTVRFLYNFFLDFLDLPFQQKDAESGEESVEGLLRKTFRDMRPGGLRTREGLEGFFRIDIPKRFSFPVFSERHGVCKSALTLKGDIPVLVSVLVSVADTGSGSCEIAVTSTSGKVEFRELHALLGLTNEIPGQQRGTVLSFPRKESRTIFGFFLDALRATFAAFRKKDGTCPITWPAIWHECRDWKEMRYQVEWLDGEIAEFSKDKEFQQPYVFTEAVMNGDLYESIFLDTSEIVDSGPVLKMRRSYGKELASILFREAVFDNIAYIDSTFPAWGNLGNLGLWESGVATNLNLNSQLFATLHFRSAVIYVNGDLREERNPQRFMSPAFFSLVDTVRTQWYALVIINGHLDMLLRSARSIRRSRETWSRIVETILRRRMKLGLFLEDPTLYHWGGGSLPEAYAVAQQAFSLPKLEQAALQKFDLLDRVLADFVRERAKDIDFLASDFDD